MLNKTIFRRRVARLTHTLSLSRIPYSERSHKASHIFEHHTLCCSIPKILLCWYLYFGVRLNVCGCKKKSGQTLGDLFYHVLKHSYVGCSFIALPSKMLRAFCYPQLFSSLLHRFSQKVIWKMVNQLLMKTLWLLFSTVSYFYSISNYAVKRSDNQKWFLCFLVSTFIRMFCSNGDFYIFLLHL